MIYINICIGWGKSLTESLQEILQAILNKSKRQHPSKQQLYGQLPSILDEAGTRDTAGDVGTNS